jgi:hypothetical protein
MKNPPRWGQHPNGVPSQSPGLAVLFAAYPGKRCVIEATLKGLHSNYVSTQPFQGRSSPISLPRVERHGTPLNPGLCDEAPLGLLKSDTSRNDRSYREIDCEQRHSNGTPSQIPASIVSHLDEASALKGHFPRAQGWPRCLRPTLGNDAHGTSTLKGLHPDSTLSG